MKKTSNDNGPSTISGMVTTFVTWDRALPKHSTPALLLAGGAIVPFLLFVLTQLLPRLIEELMIEAPSRYTFMTGSYILAYSTLPRTEVASIATYIANIGLIEAALLVTLEGRGRTSPSSRAAMINQLVWFNLLLVFPVIGMVVGFSLHARTGVLICLAGQFYMVLRWYCTLRHAGLSRFTGILRILLCLAATSFTSGILGFLLLGIGRCDIWRNSVLDTYIATGNAPVADRIARSACDEDMLDSGEYLSLLKSWSQDSSFSSSQEHFSTLPRALRSAAVHTAGSLRQLAWGRFASLEDIIQLPTPYATKSSLRQSARNLWDKHHL